MTGTVRTCGPRFSGGVNTDPSSITAAVLP